jgi:hypothetical protein
MAMAASQSASGTAEWAGRVRFCLAAGLVWAGLHFFAGGFLLPHGLDRPLVLSAAPHYSFLPGLLVIGLLWVGAAVATVLVGRGGQRQVLMALGLALALWAAESGRRGGTIDSWLILRNDAQGAPTGGPYWRLLADYVYLLLGIAGAYAICRRLGHSTSPTPSDAGASGAGQPTPSKHASAMKARPGPLATLVATVVAAIVVFFLMGPNLAETRRGQVYFAVLVGSLVGTLAADRLTQVRDPLWYWPVPFIVGLIGLLAAGFCPALMLPSEYKHINLIPAWGLARALPVEMIGVGLLGIVWLLPATPTAAAEEGS